MAFDIKTWKERVKARLDGWKKQTPEINFLAENRSRLKPALINGKDGFSNQSASADFSSQQCILMLAFNA